MEGKVFCLSMQRTGTSSVGQFFRDHGLKTAGWEVSHKNDWTQHWYNGDFERIFSSTAFQEHEAFEDSPWWAPEFYKVLFHRFPKARFVLLTRDPNEWFQSMLNHSKINGRAGKNPGNTQRHAKMYRREWEYYQLFDMHQPQGSNDGSMFLEMENMQEHYTQYYVARNREVKDFFHKNNPDALFTAELSDPHKWKNMGAFLGISVADQYTTHKNESKGSITPL